MRQAQAPFHPDRHPTQHGRHIHLASPIKAIARHRKFRRKHTLKGENDLSAPTGEGAGRG